MLSLQSSSIGHWIIRPYISYNSLCSQVKANNDNYRRYKHGLEWYEGDIIENQLKRRLLDIAKSAKTIFVYGKNDLKYIETLICRSVVDLKKYHCPSYDYIKTIFKSQDQCLIHGLKVLENPSFTYCTLYKASLLKLWLLSLNEQYSSENNVDRDDGDVYFDLLQAYKRKIELDEFQKEFCEETIEITDEDENCFSKLINQFSRVLK